MRQTRVEERQRHRSSRDRDRDRGKERERDRGRERERARDRGRWGAMRNKAFVEWAGRCGWKPLGIAVCCSGGSAAK